MWKRENEPFNDFVYVTVINEFIFVTNPNVAPLSKHLGIIEKDCLISLVLCRPFCFCHLQYFLINT